MSAYIPPDTRTYFILALRKKRLKIYGIAVVNCFQVFHRPQGKKTLLGSLI